MQAASAGMRVNEPPMWIPDLHDDEERVNILPRPSALLVKRMLTTARAVPRSTDHHGLACISETKQLFPGVIAAGSWFPSTAFDARFGPRVTGLGAMYVLLANVGRLSATLTFKCPNTASIATTL